MKARSFGRYLFFAVAAAASLLMFTWPLFISSIAQSEAQLAQLAFFFLMPTILILAVNEYSSGSIDSRQLALLGVLSALNALIRMLGAGAAGIETAFFLIIISAYVFGSGFGFLMGAISLLVSGLITGGIGPWLPFQMMAAALIGAGAGLLPKLRRSWLEVLQLIFYGAISSFVFGSLMTIWNWPFLAGIGSDVSYLAGAGLIENLTRFLQYEILTGGLLWDTGRAITTMILIAVTAPALLTTLRRAANRAGIRIAELEKR
jgi:energy-coupling factor transport system substrate-specific component